jgi:hypothetical protein
MDLAFCQLPYNAEASVVSITLADYWNNVIDDTFRLACDDSL